MKGGTFCEFFPSIITVGVCFYTRQTREPKQLRCSGSFLYSLPFKFLTSYLFAPFTGE